MGGELFTVFRLKILKERDSLEDLGINETEIRVFILRACTGFGWLTRGTSDWLP